MSSCLLFHGPGARQTALNHANEYGRLLAPPFGDEGLKVEAAREASELLSVPPVGESVGFIILGPMEQASPAASDALLKNIEFFPDGVKPLLWTHDLGGVSPVIRSRCLDRWCPATEDEEENQELINLAYDLVEAVLQGHVYRIGALLNRKETVAKKNEVELLGLMADVLTADLKDPKRRALWERIRSVALWSNPNRLEIAAALLE